MNNPAYNGLDTRNPNIFAPDVSYTINLLDKDKNIMGISGSLVFSDTSAVFPKMGTADLHDQSGTSYGHVSLVNAPFRVVANLNNLPSFGYGFIKLGTSMHT